jgi:hypothetical protein
MEYGGKDNFLLINNDNHIFQYQWLEDASFDLLHWLHMEKSEVFDELLKQQASSARNSNIIVDAEDTGDDPDLVCTDSEYSDTNSGCGDETDSNVVVSITRSVTRMIQMTVHLASCLRDSQENPSTHSALSRAVRF